MEQKHTIAMLTSLARLELDSTRCFGEAMRRVGSPEKEHLAGFLAQHDSHVDRITSMLGTFGQVGPVSLPENRRLFTSGMREISGGEPLERTLEDIAANERLLISQYQKEQSPALSARESEILDRNLADEYEHLRYLEERIRALRRKEGKT